MNTSSTMEDMQELNLEEMDEVGGGIFLLPLAVWASSTAAAGSGAMAGTWLMGLLGTGVALGNLAVGNTGVTYDDNDGDSSNGQAYFPLG